MRLAVLAYEIARDAIEVSSGFNFDSFIRGDYDDDRDYKQQISFAFNYINLALSLLESNRKTLLKIASERSDDKGYVGFIKGEITAVVNSLAPNFEHVHWKPFADGFVVEEAYVGKDIFVEYRPRIPHFGLDSIRVQKFVDGDLTNAETKIDLNDYGVTDVMCSFIKEYAKGGLMEYLDPSISQTHVSLASSYISSLRTRYSEFPPRVANRFGFGGAL